VEQEKIIATHSGGTSMFHTVIIKKHYELSSKDLLLPIPAGLRFNLNRRREMQTLTLIILSRFFGDLTPTKARKIKNYY
jgi:hypothetical protein